LVLELDINHRRSQWKMAVIIDILSTWQSVLSTIVHSPIPLISSCTTVVGCYAKSSRINIDHVTQKQWRNNISMSGNVVGCSASVCSFLLM
jgi:hypothetical protein